MIDEHYQDLLSVKRGRLILWAEVRSLLIAAVLVVLCYVLPLDRPWDSDTAIRLLVFAGVLVWQVRTIAGWRYPGVRAAEALGLIIRLFLVLFASTYFLMEGGLRGELHPAADPHGRVVLHGDRLVDGGSRGHHRQIRDRPGRAHRPDARRPRTSRRRSTSGPRGVSRGRERSSDTGDDPGPAAT